MRVGAQPRRWERFPRVVAPAVVVPALVVAVVVAVAAAGSGVVSVMYP